MSFTNDSVIPSIERCLSFEQIQICEYLKEDIESKNLSLRNYVISKIRNTIKLSHNFKDDLINHYRSLFSNKIVFNLNNSNLLENFLTEYKYTFNPKYFNHILFKESKYKDFFINYYNILKDREIKDHYSFKTFFLYTIKSYLRFYPPTGYLYIREIIDLNINLFIKISLTCLCNCNYDEKTKILYYLNILVIDDIQVNLINNENKSELKNLNSDISCTLLLTDNQMIFCPESIKEKGLSLSNSIQHFLVQGYIFKTNIDNLVNISREILKHHDTYLSQLNFTSLCLVNQNINATEFNVITGSILKIEICFLQKVL